MTDDREPFREAPSATARAIRAIKAQALREAADDLYSDAGPGNMFSTATWLRERADKLEATDVV